MNGQAFATWCEDDNHFLYERHMSFNDWLDGKSEDAEQLLDQLGLANIGTPSKALFAGDYPAYEQAVSTFLIENRHAALGAELLDAHWFKKNLAHFEQLVDVLKGNSVVPFLGAGVSCASGYPSWSAHLASQAKTAGIFDISIRLASGLHEEVVQEILDKCGETLFVQSIRDDFLGTPLDVNLTMKIAALCRHLMVTTNYDKCVELALSQMGSTFYDTINATEGDNLALIVALSNRRRALLKLHGDVTSPTGCILSKSNYDAAYGPDLVDMSRPLPRKLRRLYEGTNLLFVGCSLIADRTVDVFRKVMAERGASDLPQHFAIVEVPRNENELSERNRFLASLGITPIWYAYEEHHRVIEIVEALQQAVDS
jgi:SIR2-like domain